MKEMNQRADVIIVGSGVAGLFCALNLPKEVRVLLLTKKRLEDSDSYLAQGGICMKRDAADFDSFYEDTMAAGHYKNDPAAVALMINSSQDVVRDLVGFGVDFERDETGFLFTREGGHSRPRILYHEDTTGREIMTKLAQRVMERPNLVILEFETMVDILEEDGRCLGVVSKDAAGEVHRHFAPVTVLACGGVGGLFPYSTNFPHITGDAIAIALDHGIATENLDLVQMHPTALYDPGASRCLLISESVRGEGAVLLNAAKERFTDELKPRDVVSRAVLEQMEKDGKPHVYLAMQPLGEAKIRAHFPFIMESCRQKGIDVLTEYIPVVPAQHYLMGGIKVDLNSLTSLERLYAIGETSCNGVHGANRLASNSLLESLVFARQAARHIMEQKIVEQNETGNNAGIAGGQDTTPEENSKLLESARDLRKDQYQLLKEHYQHMVRDQMKEHSHA